MANNRTMEELLQAPTEGYGEAIVIPEINADHFEIKTNLLQLVQANPYHGFERENPHTHIKNFKRITSTLKFRDVPNDVIKLMMFPYSLEGNARVWYDKEPPSSILTWEDLRNASKSDDIIDKLADQILTLVDIFAKKVVIPVPVKAFEESCVTCGRAHAYYNFPNTDSNQPSVCVATGKMKAITTRSGVAYEGPSIPNPKKVVERDTEEKTNKEKTNFQGSTALIQPLVTPIMEPDVPKTLCKPNIPYPSRLNFQNLGEKATNQMEKFFQIFQDFHFDISFADALILMPIFASMINSLLTNKDKLFELAKIPLNENFSTMLLKKLPKKLVDPGKFLIPCDFSGMDLSLPKLTPTRMNLELADRSITRLKGVAEDAFVKVGKFYFLTDFVVVDFEADPRVPLILGRSFLRTGHALIDVYGEEITLRVNDEIVTFNLNQTTRYSSTYDDFSVNRIDIIDVAREEYAQEILGFSNNSSGGNPTSTFEPIRSDSSPSLTPFEGSDFILDENDAYLKDESISLEIDHADCDSERDICWIEKLLNNDPFQLPPMDLKQGEVVKEKYSIEEPPELVLKILPSHLEYAYLEGIDKLPVIITKDLKVDEKEALLKVLKYHKRAIAWKITDIKGIDPRFCTHKILMEEDYKHAVQSQRWDMIKKTMEEKCHFMVKEGLVLGHKISKNGLGVDRSKVDVIAKLPYPTTVKGVRSFLRHTGFYRRFIQDFSKIARPMTHLLEKETPFVFSKDCINAFETLKKKLTEAPILVVPEFNLPFELICDASDFTIGAVLGQRKTKHFQPIHYASKTMTKAQIHYTTTEKEMLTVVGKIDQTLFIKKQKGDILLVQVYVDDIIFGSTNKDLCKAFEKLMEDKFQMSSMGELTFFSGLQVKQKQDGIFISQDKHVAKILRKFGLIDRKSASTPIDTEKPLLKILMTVVATSSTEAEYVAAASCCAQQFWTSVSIKKSNDVVRLQALIDRKKEIITEDSIRQALRLDDADSVDYLPNEVFFVELARMGYEKPIVHVSNNVLRRVIDISVVCEGDGDGIAGVGEGGAIDITKIKQRVRRLEKKRQYKSLGLKRLHKGRLPESQANVYHLDLEHAKKVLSMQDTDKAETVEVKEVIKVVTAAKLMIEVVTTAATPITTAQVPKASASRRRRGVIIQDPEEIATASIIMYSEVKSKDKGKEILVEEPKPLKRQAQIEQDEAFTRQ
nr:reverse transcriptase domain-containing protein [Tanacetum cinerariifolium]